MGRRRLCGAARCVVLAAGLHAALACAAAGPRVVAGESGVFCRRAGTAVAGVMCELVGELQSRLRYDGGIELVPHARLKALMRQPASNTFFLPAVAGLDNGPALQTVIEMLHDEYVIVSSSRADPRPATLQTARGFDRVGVLRGSSAQLEAVRQGFSNLEPAASQETCAKKLDLGRIGGWISTWNGARYSAGAAGIDVGTLVRGARVRDARLILVASADVPAAEIARWRRAFQAMRADGTVGRLYRRYDIEAARAAP